MWHCTACWLCTCRACACARICVRKIVPSLGTPMQHTYLRYTIRCVCFRGLSKISCTVTCTDLGVLSPKRGAFSSILFGTLCGQVYACWWRNNECVQFAKGCERHARKSWCFSSQNSGQISEFPSFLGANHSAAHTRMEALPPELLIAILQKLPTRTVQQECALVCKRWCDASRAPAFWKQLVCHTYSHTCIYAYTSCTRAHMHVHVRTCACGYTCRTTINEYDACTTHHTAHLPAHICTCLSPCLLFFSQGLVSLVSPNPGEFIATYWGEEAGMCASAQPYSLQKTDSRMSSLFHWLLQLFFVSLPPFYLPLFFSLLLPVEHHPLALCFPLFFYFLFFNFFLVQTSITTLARTCPLLTSLCLASSSINDSHLHILTSELQNVTELGIRKCEEKPKRK